MNEWEKFLEKQAERKRNQQAIRVKQCPGHWWLPPEPSEVLNFPHSNELVPVSNEDIFCETCGIKRSY